MNILPNVLHTFLRVLTRRICLTIKSFLNWRSFALFSDSSLCDSEMELQRNIRRLLLSRGQRVNDDNDDDGLLLKA